MRGGTPTPPSGLTKRQRRDWQRRQRMLPQSDSVPTHSAASEGTDPLAPRLTVAKDLPSPPQIRPQGSPPRNGELSPRQEPRDRAEGTTFLRKISEFWTSTPVWSVISVLITLIVSPWSIALVYTVLWAVLCFEFIRLEIFERRLRRYLANIVFAVIVGISFRSGWPYLPKPKNQPNLDQALEVLGDRIVDKISARLARQAPLRLLLHGRPRSPRTR